MGKEEIIYNVIIFYKVSNNFNIRVYGIWIQDDKVLINEEDIKGTYVIKLPGGGLVWGEGTTDCLKREWKEELGLDIEIVRHFYTTDYFQPSAFDNSQVISIYYLVTADKNAVIANNLPNERTYWVDAACIDADTFTLPIDKIVGGMLKEHLRNSNR